MIPQDRYTAAFTWGAAGLLNSWTILLGVGLAAAAQPIPRMPPTLDAVKRCRTQEDVRKLLGDPARVARQILYQRHLEQWIYQQPLPLRLEFDCPRGREPAVIPDSIQPYLPGRS
jgi:hypothetical protein